MVDSHETARSRSRSLGAPSSGQTSSESARLRVTRGRSSGSQHGPDVLPERARLARRAVVGRRLADEVEPSRRPCAGRVEEVAGPRDRVGLREPRSVVELAPPVVVEERRARGALREDALLEPEDEHDLRAARARAQQVEHRHVPRAHGAEPDLRPLQRGDQLLRRELRAQLHPGLELVQQRERSSGTSAGRSDASGDAGGASSPYAARSIEAARSRTAAIEVGAERRRSSGARGCPRSSTIVASRRSGERIPRPRSRPSRKSAWARARPE